MKPEFFAETSAWLTQAGLVGTAETDIVSQFCDRCVAAGLPVSRVHVFIDTLHPVHEGRLIRWGQQPNEPSLLEYGRTNSAALAASDADAHAIDAAERWRQSPFYRMLQTGESTMRRRLIPQSDAEFSAFAEMRGFGMTDYLAIINRFAADGTIGEMDCVYSSWATNAPGGFSEDQLTGLKWLTPFLALAIKSVALARMTGTLMQTYLGRDAGSRVLSGRIVRGVADRIDAVIWFSDLRGFTRITDTQPEEVIPLLNDSPTSWFRRSTSMAATCSS
jgi:adenylate cyclase